MPHPAPLPDHLTRFDATPDDVFADYLAAIRAHIDNHPRSQQVRLGPSELGDPCLRKLGYKLLEVPQRPLPPNWKATVGTACHAWAEGAFDADNLRRAANDLEGQERWLVEPQLTVGFVPGYGFVTGHSDLYDRTTAFNLDHKFLGRSSLAKYAKEPPTVYKAQAHLYGQGWRLAGLPIRRVGICFLPRDGELADGFMWSEEFNPAAAQWALDRLAALHARTQQHGRAVLADLETAESYCSHCPWFRPGATDATQGCAGHPGSRAATPQAPALTFGAGQPNQ